MKFLYTFLLPTLLCTGSVIGSQEETVELVKTELHYCRYIAYEARHENVPLMHAIEWMDGIIETALDQLEEEFKEGDLSQAKDQFPPLCGAQ